MTSKPRLLIEPQAMRKLQLYPDSYPCNFRHQSKARGGSITVLDNADRQIVVLKTDAESDYLDQFSKNKSTEKYWTRTLLQERINSRLHLKPIP